MLMSIINRVPRCDLVILLLADLTQVFAVRDGGSHGFLVVVFLQHKLASAVAAYMDTGRVEVDVDLGVAQCPPAVAGNHPMGTNHNWILANEINSKACVHEFVMVDKSNFSVVVGLKDLSSVRDRFVAGSFRRRSTAGTKSPRHCERSCREHSASSRK